MPGRNPVPLSGYSINVTMELFGMDKLSVTSFGNGVRDQRVSS